MKKYLLIVALLLSACGAVAQNTGVKVTGDWPMWGGNAARNMLSGENNLPRSFDPGKIDDKTEHVIMSTTKNVKWVAKLGSESYGNPVVANGKIFIGTNNAAPRDKTAVGDRGIIYCLNESDGKLIWQLVVPKLGAQKESDWEELGICSSPTVEGDYVYLVTNRCEVICLDVNGLTNGNAGPFKDEAKYKAGKGPVGKLLSSDADIIWIYNMIDELGVFPHNITSSSALVVGDKLFVTTSNGKDKTHNNMPAPNAPCLIALDKKTGKLLGEEMSGIGDRVMHCNWSSPSHAKINGKDLIFFGGGDGVCYAFDSEPVFDKEEELNVLPEVWRFDCNPPSYRKDNNGKEIEYATRNGPSEIIATPVFHNNRIYVSIGQDPEHENGIGNLSCIDVTKKGDVTKSAKIWESRAVERSISTVAIYNGLVFVPDYTGYLHCFDANTGKRHWKFDTGAHIWSSPLVVDGHIYLGNEDGLLFVIEAKGGSKANKISEIDMDAPIYSSAIAANGVLYVATQSHLYAVAK